MSEEASSEPTPPEQPKSRFKPVPSPTKLRGAKEKVAPETPSDPPTPEPVSPPPETPPQNKPKPELRGGDWISGSSYHRFGYQTPGVEPSKEYGGATPGHEHYPYLMSEYAPTIINRLVERSDFQRSPGGWAGDVLRALEKVARSMTQHNTAELMKTDPPSSRIEREELSNALWDKSVDYLEKNRIEQFNELVKLAQAGDREGAWDKIKEYMDRVIEDSANLAKPLEAPDWRPDAIPEDYYAMSAPQEPEPQLSTPEEVEPLASPQQTPTPTHPAPSLHEAASPRQPIEVNLGKGPLQGDTIKDQLKNFTEGDELIRTLKESGGGDLARELFNVNKDMYSFRDQYEAALKKYGKDHEITHNLARRYNENLREAKRLRSEAEKDAWGVANTIADALGKDRGEGERLKLIRKTVSNSNLTEQHTRDMDAAENWLNKAFTRSPDEWIPAFYIMNSDNKRGGYSYKGQQREGGVTQTKNVIYLPEVTDAAVSIHELIHHVAHYSPSVAEAEAEFAQHLFGDEEFSNMGEKFPHLGYTDRDQGRKDRLDAYFSDHQAYYIGKKGEVLTNFVEALVRDPKGFAEALPECFKWTIGVLSGRIRGQGAG